jgi:ribonucleoside-diphosphate reductase alpha chain
MTTEIYNNFNRTITIDNERDRKLTRFAKQTLKDRYLWTDETFQQMFARVAAVNSDDDAHAQRLYDYISNLWFMPATPVLSNSGSKKNLTISCFLNQMGDSLSEIFETQLENKWLASRGGGIGTNLSEIRSIGEPVGGEDETGRVGETSGAIPFVVSTAADCLAISQGNLRRGSAAFYLDVNHPEIEEFVELRNPHKGAPERKALHAHHGVVITNAFMEAVKVNADWDLVSPKTKAVIKTIKARKLWEQILERRINTGEPYLWFVDTVNEKRPLVYKKNGLLNSTSNLCSEITLTTGIDYNGRRRTAVCCLSSVNLETYDQWQDNKQFLEDVLRFLDNNMQNFIENTHGVPGFERPNYSARMERSIGLGVMGFHSFLQKNKIPFEGVMAKVWNKKIHKWLKETADEVNDKLATERGPCPDAARVGLNVRFSHMFAVAPTASISIICGEASPGIEPFTANIFKQKTLSGQFIVRNKWLNACLQVKYVKLHGYDDMDPDYDKKQKAWVEAQWAYIMDNEHGKGSVQGLPYLDELEKEVFKTAFEIDQNWIIEHAADRQEYICQGQSVNIFVYATAKKSDINKLHFKAWSLGLKGLYYNRSRSTLVATNVVGEMPQAIKQPDLVLKEVTHLEEPVADMDFEEDEGCMACQ